jgi:hypothetical protein
MMARLVFLIAISLARVVRRRSWDELRALAYYRGERSVIANARATVLCKFYIIGVFVHSYKWICVSTLR